MHGAISDGWMDPPTERLMLYQANEIFSIEFMKNYKTEFSHSNESIVCKFVCFFNETC